MRLASRLTLGDIGKAAGVSAAVVDAWERGAGAPTTAEALAWFDRLVAGRHLADAAGVVTFPIGGVTICRPGRPAAPISWPRGSGAPASWGWRPTTTASLAVARPSSRPQALADKLWAALQGATAGRSQPLLNRAATRPGPSLTQWAPSLPPRSRRPPRPSWPRWRRSSCRSRAWSARTGAPRSRATASASAGAGRARS